MNLLDDETLERSAVVANCRMNRERDRLGSNRYDPELGFNPLDLLQERAASGRSVARLDLCCGTAKALIQAARMMQDGPTVDRIDIVGVDLVGLFDPPEPYLTRLRLVEASLTSWRPDRTFTLITCVHGLHYVGDKLGLISRAASWLAEDGLLVANLDMANVKVDDGQEPSRVLTDSLRRAGVLFNRRKRTITCRGRRTLDLPYRNLGADDQAGPNSTGQLAVNSYLGSPIRQLPDSPSASYNRSQADQDLATDAQP